MSHRLLVLALAGTLGALPSTSGRVETDGAALSRAAALTERGERALKAGNLKRALGNYDDALRIVPELPDAHVGRGHVLMREQRFAEAHAAFVAARDGYAALGDSLNDLRVDRYHQSRAQAEQLRQSVAEMNASIDRMEASASQSPDANAAAQLRQQARMVRMRASQYEQELQRLEQVQPPDLSEHERIPGELYFFIGNALLNLERLDEAVGAWEECARKSPKFALVYNNLAVGYWRSGRLHEAREAMRRAEELGFQLHPEFKADLESALAEATARAEARR